jgi:hypothetical protein
MTTRKTSATIATLFAMASFAHASDYVVVSANFDVTRAPQNLFNAANDCDKSAVCKAFVKAASAATEIPMDKVVSVAATFAQTKDGEGTYIDLKLPAGYSYCSGTVNVYAIVPRDGSRGSTTIARADAQSMHIATWTPEQGAFGGNSYVRGDATVMGIRDGLAASNTGADKPCRSRGSRVWFYCRGSGCEGGASDSGQAVDASSPPSAGSRK